MLSEVPNLNIISPGGRPSPVLVSCTEFCSYLDLPRKNIAFIEVSLATVASITFLIIAYRFRYIVWYARSDVYKVCEQFRRASFMRAIGLFLFS